jgi:hypothetical protein
VILAPDIDSWLVLLVALGGRRGYVDGRIILRVFTVISVNL